MREGGRGGAREGMSEGAREEDRRKEGGSYSIERDLLRTDKLGRVDGEALFTP